MFSQSKELRERGFLLVKLSEAKVRSARHLFKSYLRSIPEHVQGAEIEGDFGAGSFGGINYASAYHCPAATFIDEFVAEEMEPILTALGALQGLSQLELLPDRLCYRTKAQPKESWHTDNTSFVTSSSELVFGTIVNLNKGVSQQFVCVPGTHTLGARMTGGDFTPEGAENIERWKEEEVTLVIPPKHALIFFENIVHRVSGGKPKHPILRKFVGFRLSNDKKQWCPANETQMETQGALHHKGGNLAPLYPKLWRTNWPDHCEKYSERLRPEMLTTHTYKTGKKRGRTITLPHKIPPSLGELGCKYELSESARKRFRPRSIYG
jgi:hypothetical protein